MKSNFPACLILAVMIFIAACSSLGPYDRGEYSQSSKLRHSRIPLQSGTRFKVRQGAFGKSSHNEPGNEFSWDLEVPLGTQIKAAEAGTVLYLYQPPGGGGCNSKFANDAWNVLIANRDGTVAQYTHVEGTVHPGETVSQGQAIGKTVERGWICYPHVHYSIYRSKETLYNSPNRETLPLYFDGVPNGLLMEGQVYVAP